MTSPSEQGDPASKICFIGEAPSFQEMQDGKPFVGPAGQLFERCCHSADIARAETYILNVFETQVRKDDKGAIYDSERNLLYSSKGFTDAGRQASSNCLRRVAASGANIICPLGGVALTLALDNRSITKWRGSILHARDGDGLSGRKLCATLHPSGALRGVYEWRYLISADLQRVRAESHFPDVRLTQRSLLIDPSYAECIAFLKRCLTSPIVDTDIEILNGQIDCFSLAVSPTEAISIPLIDAGWHHRWSAAEEAEIWRLYAEILSAPHIAKVNQNITFDLAALLSLNNIVPCGELHDPMIAHSVMYPALKKDLGTLCSLYTDVPYYKDQGELSDSQTVDDFARRWLYNAKDAAVALELHLELQPMLDADGYRATYDMTIASLPALIYMMVRGIRVNHDALLTTAEKARSDLAAIVARLEATFGRRVITEAPKTAAAKRAAADALNINSPAQLMKYFYDVKRVKPYVNQIGARTLDDRALARIFRRDGLPEAKLLQEYRSLSKMIGTYFEIVYDDDARMRCSYNPRGTWTGRLSSSQTIWGTGGNLQNLPEEMRGFLVNDHAT